jgi:hypothetical protein
LRDVLWADFDPLPQISLFSLPRSSSFFFFVFFSVSSCRQFCGLPLFPLFSLPFRVLHSSVKFRVGFLLLISRPAFDFPWRVFGVLAFSHTFWSLVFSHFIVFNSHCPYRKFEVLSLRDSVSAAGLVLAEFEDWTIDMASFQQAVHTELSQPHTIHSP